MKPEFLPMIRDEGKLFVLDIEETASSYRKRQRHCLQPLGKRAFRESVWPNAKWWRWRVVTCPNEFQTSRNFERDRSVVIAWQELARADHLTTRTLADILYLLIETPFVDQRIADSTGTSEFHVLLSDRRKTRQLLISSAEQWSPAISHLISENRLNRDEAEALQKFCPTESFCLDPWVFVHYRCAKEMLEVSWADTDVRSGLAFLRGGKLKRARSALLFLENLGIDDHETLIRLQHLLLTANPRGISDWLRLVSWIKNRSHRKQFIQWIHHTDARHDSPTRIGDPFFRELIHQADLYARSQIETEGILSVIRGNINADVMQDFYRLREALTSTKLHVSPPRKSQFRPDTEALIKLGILLIEQDGKRSQRHYRSGSRLVLEFWKSAVNSRALFQLVQNRQWDKWVSELSGLWIRLYLVIERLSSEPKRFRFLLSLVEESIANAPAREQPMKLEALEDLLDWLTVTPSRLLWEIIENAATVISAGKFRHYPKSGAALFIDFYFWGDFNQRWSLSFVKRSAFKAMEEAMRSSNANDAISDGAQAFLKRLPHVDLAFYFRAPEIFLRILRELGELPRNERDEILIWFSEHPAVSVDPLRISVSEAATLVDAIKHPGERDPLPAKLRATLSGGHNLRDDILRHYKEEFADHWVVFLIEILRGEIQFAFERLQQRNLDLHTVKFLARLGRTNRRGFRRFLVEIENQNGGYRDNHPANQAWLKQHRDLTLTEWVRRNTKPFSVEIDGIKNATIQLEDDPQEELKMGTYVNSCLSVGGCNQFSAVANTLDINKRIAYLRDTDGKVFARQLFAISEQEQLVSFEVYICQIAESINRTELENAFISFTEKLARTLNLPLWTPGNDYRVRPLLVPNWYDDQAWNFQS